MPSPLSSSFKQAATRAARAGVLSLIAAFALADAAAVRDATHAAITKAPSPRSEILPPRGGHSSGSPANELIRKVANLVASTRAGRDVHLKVAEHAQVERSGVRGGNRAITPPKPTGLG